MTDARGFSDVVVHIGYHKAGSTLLQNRLFVPDRGIYSAWPQDFYHRHLLLDRPDRGWAARVRSAFAPGIDAARQSGLVPVLSCEALSGDMWRPGQSNGYGNFHVADLLSEAFPGARVAIAHREQSAMVVSLYKHSLRSHWRYGLSQFLDQTPLSRGMAPVLNFGYLEYSWLAEHYIAVFGRDRVLAVPFESLRDSGDWAMRWATFLGVPVQAEWFAEKENPGFAATTVRAKRWANHLIPSAAEPNLTRSGHFLSAAAYQVDERVPDALRRRSDARLRARISSLVGDRFTQDNQRLMEVIGEDWSDLGYRASEAGPGRAP